MARPRTFDETQVARRARDAFHDHGYAATSVEQLTAATGLRRSSLYGAFGDKHGLFLRAFSQYCDEEMSIVQEQLAGEDAGAFGRLRRHLRSKTSDPAASRRGCMLAKATAELAGEDPDVARIAADAYGIYEQALIDCVRGAQAAGDARSDLDPADAGALLLAVLRGIEALGRAGRPKRALRVIADTALTSLATRPLGPSSPLT
jgi:TetR/AcrR family transcriptional regulator, transcriptional repressor for nem operon